MDDDKRNFQAREGPLLSQHIEALNIDPTIKQSLLVIARKILAIVEVEHVNNPTIIFIGHIAAKTVRVSLKRSDARDAEVKMEQLLATMTVEERERLKTLLNRGPSLTVKTMATWMNGIDPYRIPLPTDAELDKFPMDAIEQGTTKKMTEQVVSALIAWTENKPLETLGKYLGVSSLAPVASNEHSIPALHGMKGIDVAGLFEDLSQDNRYGHFLDELSPLVRSAAESLFALLLDATPTDIEPAQTEQEIRKHVGHVVKTMTFLRTHLYLYIMRHLKSQKELDCLIGEAVLDSALDAWYLDAFAKRTSNILVYVTKKTLDRQECMFSAALKEIIALRDIFTKTSQEAKNLNIRELCVIGGAECARAYALTHQMYHLLKLPMVEEGQRGEMGPRPAYAPWLHVSMFENNEWFKWLTTNRDVGGLSRRRVTKTAYAPEDAKDPSGISIWTSVCRHRPGDPPTMTTRTFIPTERVFGREHPVTKQSARLARIGDEGRADALRIAERLPWLEKAHTRGFAVRYIIDNEISQNAEEKVVEFFLLTKTETDALNLRNEVIPLPPNVYEHMGTFNYPFPEKDGRPCAAEDLFCYIVNDGG